MGNTVYFTDEQLKNLTKEQIDIWSSLYANSNIGFVEQSHSKAASVLHKMGLIEKYGRVYSAK